MKLARNPEIAKLYTMLLILFAVCIILACILAAVSVQSYTTLLITNQAALIGAVIDEYPDADVDIIRQLAEADEQAVRVGQDLLSKYGYHSDELIHNIESMRERSRYLTALYVGWTMAVFAALFIIFHIFLHRRYRTVHQLNEYTRSIADGREFLDIRDNGEGEFSLLKNEVYTITSMLKEQTEALTREKISLSDSIADISHQLKTPMTSLSVMTDLLMENPSADMRAEFLRRIRSQLDRMEWLVSSLLKLSKLDAGTITMRREPVVVSRLVRKVLDTLSIPIEIKQHQVTVTGDDSVQMNVDPEWTGEALINIMKNCIEHTPERGHIRVEVESNPIFTRITIADNGEGIDAKDLPYIFNRFYKGSNAGDDSVGIGLAMAHAIIKQQNGDITVQSEKNIGTAFILTFYKQRI